MNVNGEGLVKDEMKANLLKMKEMKHKGTFSTSSIQKNIVEVTI